MKSYTGADMVLTVFATALLTIAFAGLGQVAYQDIEKNRQREKQTMTAQEQAEAEQERKAERAKHEAIAQVSFHPDLPPGWKLMKDGNGEYFLKTYSPATWGWNDSWDWYYWTGNKLDCTSERVRAKRFNCAKQAIKALNDTWARLKKKREIIERRAQETEVTE